MTLAPAPASPYKIAVLGASGYAGAELIRLLTAHPGVEVVLAAAPSGEGQPLATVHPSLRGLTRLTLEQIPQSVAAWPAVDAIFLCLPHGASRDLVPQLPPTAKVIDLGGDFRLRDREVFAQYYGCAAPPSTWQSRFVYGQVETTPRAALAAATHIANPGCFATAVILALAPLVRADLIETRVIVDAKTGSTGSGAKPSAGTQHADRMNSFYAYKSFRHQHLPEIQQALGDVACAADGRSSWGQDLVLQTHSTPLVRGIFASVYARLRSGVTLSRVEAAFAQAYGEQPFLRLVAGSPNVNWSRGSNFVDLGWACEGRELAVFSALDNLGKGAAGQAVQNMNLIFGLPEAMGLWQAGGVP